MSNKHNLVNNGIYYDPIIKQYVGLFGGSTKNITDEHGNILTKGYHSFHLENGTLMGNLGSSTEIVKCDFNK